MALLSYGASLQNITAQSLMLLHVLFSACTFRLFFTRYQFSMNFQFSTAVEWAACVGYALRLCTVNMTASVWIFIFVCVHDYQYVCVFVCVCEWRFTTQAFISFCLRWQLPINVCAKIFASLIFHTLRPLPACLFSVCVCVFECVCWRVWLYVFCFYFQ